MKSEDPIQTLRLIEKAVLAIQGRFHPGRPVYYALGRLHSEVRNAQREVLAQTHGAKSGGA